MVGKQEVVTTISKTIHEFDASILTQEDANALATAAANKVQISLEERLNIIDTELAKASSASSAAQDLISNNLAAVSGEVDDSLQALDCLSDKVTAMSGYIDDEVTTVKINAARYRTTSRPCPTSLTPGWLPRSQKLSSFNAKSGITCGALMTSGLILLMELGKTSIVVWPLVRLS